MNKKIQEKIIDITDVELTPGSPAVCLGNGKQGFECCCDECNYFLLCFPEFDVQLKKETTAASKKRQHNRKNDRECNVFSVIDLVEKNHMARFYNRNR